jgi:hypothetical protein
MNMQAILNLARHFKTEPSETVALCFGCPKTPCLRTKGKLSFSVDEQDNSNITLHWPLGIGPFSSDSWRISVNKGAKQEYELLL